MRISKISIVLLSGIALLGCAPRPDTPQELSAKWSAGHDWGFILQGETGSSIGEVTLHLTEEKATSCLSGDWLKATSLTTTINDAEQRSWFTSASNGPAYRSDGKELHVLINPNTCDGYFVLIGRFDAGFVRGELRTLSIEGSRSIGTFEARAVE